MSDKRQIRKELRQLQKVKTWQLVILLILGAFLAATFLRLNNVGMVERRNAIEGADKAGDIQSIASRIYDIQRYAAAHMNATTGVFYLQETYNRDVKQAMAAASGESGGANSPQARADAICNPNLQSHGYSAAYQECMLNELTKAGQVADPTALTSKLPSPALYRYSFVSPVWSPDFAGWSLVVCAILLLIIVFRLLALGVLRFLLRKHYREV